MAEGVGAGEGYCRRSDIGFHYRRGEDVPLVPSAADSLILGVDFNDIACFLVAGCGIPCLEGYYVSVLEVIRIIPGRPGRTIVLQGIDVSRAAVCHHVYYVSIGE